MAESGGIADNAEMDVEQGQRAKDRGDEWAGMRVHFIGVGGSGMSGLAMMAAARGAVVSGSDLNDSDAVKAVRAAGVNVVLEQSTTSLPPDAELVVHSAAIKPDHPERAEARRRGMQVVKYAQMLGRMMHGRTGVSVAGTHGKSTTTSMLAHVLIAAGVDPSVIVGARCGCIGGGSRTSGRSDRGTPMVVEACEYDRSFLHLHPMHGCVLNIEADHLDMYGGIEDIIDAFAAFAARIPSEGSLLIEHGCQGMKRVTGLADCEVETIGFDREADWRVAVAREATVGDGAGRNITKLFGERGRVASWASPLPGRHMAYNAAVAGVMAHRLGVGWSDVERGLASFGGLDRRMQIIGQIAAPNAPHGSRRESDDAPVTIVDDYGHHPTEVAATLAALREHHRPARLICVFQPHQHSRTRFLLDDFARSFAAAEVVVVPDIYFVRDSEAEREAVTALDLVERVRGEGVEAEHIAGFDEIVEYLQSMLRPGDLVVTMGAGDVWRVSRGLLAGGAGAM